MKYLLLAVLAFVGGCALHDHVHPTPQCPDVVVKGQCEAPTPAPTYKKPAG